MKKFQIVDKSNGCEIGDVFEADDTETALREVLEQQGFEIKAVKEETKKVSFSVEFVVSLPENIDTESLYFHLKQIKDCFEIRNTLTSLKIEPVNLEVYETVKVEQL